MGKFFGSLSTWFAAHRKTVVAVIAPVVVVIDTIIEGGSIDWPVAIAAVLSALGVYAVPNRPSAG